MQAYHANIWWVIDALIRYTAYTPYLESNKYHQKVCSLPVSIKGDSKFNSFTHPISWYRAFADRRGYLIMSLSRITTWLITWSLQLSEINNITYAVKTLYRRIGQNVIGLYFIKTEWRKPCCCDNWYHSCDMSFSPPSYTEGCTEPSVFSICANAD